MDHTIDSFLDRLGARTPTPGGGAAAGLSCALGASLLAMVANYTSGARYAEIEAEMKGYAAELASLNAEALAAMQADDEAFGAVAAGYALPRDTDEQRAERSVAIQAGLIGAVEPPKQLARICRRLVALAETLAHQANRSVLSDVGVGAACAGAALDGALLNLAINRSQIQDETIRAELDTVIAEAAADRERLRAVVDDVRASVTG